ncbi:MAG TPA: LLM class flavin-dependent oxidoreductase [Methylomirabilota bacterium]|jgi:natural product biosynthesis luciferase-like monooxygenase protein|nr:LLM class flavin-dependent oxidoreductase [Methylomirabilota bacterium]
MRFGLNFFPSFRAADMSAAEYFDDVLRLSERADQLGLSSIKAVEHYFHSYGGYTPNPIVLLSAVAARTRRVRLITGAVIPAFNHPIKLAGELSMLDNLCHGRLDVGFGRAFIPREFDAFGVRMEDSRARFEEGIDAVVRLWTEECVSQEGRFHTFRDIHLLPRPVQRPHPPVWVAAIQSRESFVWAARRGYNLMIVPYAGSIDRVAELVAAYREAWRAAGHPPGAEQIQSSLHCYIAETYQAAVDGYRRPMTRYLEVFAEAVESWKQCDSAQYVGYDKMVASIASTTPESLLEQQAALVGTPDTVVQQIHHHRRMFGEHEPSLQINFGGMAESEARRTLELLAGQVMPHFSG